MAWNDDLIDHVTTFIADYWNGMLDYLYGHKVQHQASGVDEIKLDDLGAPDDNTDLDATTSAHGLMPKADGNAGHFYCSDGTQKTPAGGGDVVGPAVSTDNSIVRFDGLTGDVIQDTPTNPPTISDAGVITAPAGIVADITGDVSGSSGTCTGNAATATVLATPRTINGVSFNGSVNIETKLDDCAAPDDNTDLDCSTSKHGLMPKMTGSTLTFYRSDGAQATPSATGSLMPFSVVTGATQTAAVNTGYIINYASATKCVVTLPATCAVGDRIRVAQWNETAGAGWKIQAPGADDYVKYGEFTTTVGTSGYLQSSGLHDAVELVCVVANTGWLVISAIGSITVN